MIKGYYCLDGEKIDKEECWKQCRMGDECAPQSYLKLCSEERTWSGVPSVTQLLNGTLESYLKLTEDYYIDPNEMAFAVSGTKKHGNLEDHGSLPETHVVYEGIQGTADEIEGSTLLVDYKTSGSYKVAQCLGIAIEKQKIPDGFFKNGNRKYRTESGIVQVNGDWGDYDMQVNMYRIMLREAKGLKIDRQKIFFIVRDGSTYMATNRGIRRNIYYADVPFLDDGMVLRYFFDKRDKLLSHLATETTPPICSPEERWHDRKCQDYCPVRFVCPHRQGE